MVLNIVNRQFIEGVLKAWRINVRWGGIEAFKQSELRSARRLAAVPSDGVAKPVDHWLAALFTWSEALECHSTLKPARFFYFRK